MTQYIIISIYSTIKKKVIYVVLEVCVLAFYILSCPYPLLVVMMSKLGIPAVRLELWPNGQ